MSKILEMIEKRNKAWEGAKAFVESKRDKDGLLSTEDAAAYAAMEQKVKDYGAEIARLQEMEAMEQELAKPVNTPLTGKPMSTTEKPEKTGRASEAYKQAMLTALRTNFRQVSNVLSEGVDANGGYLVPEEYDHRLIDILDEENVMRKLGTRITTSGEHKINIAATKPAAAWIEEGGALTFGDATFDQIILDAHKLHVAIKVTEELLYDNAFNLESYIMQQFGKALANAEEDAFINGTGTGQPLGILAATGGADVGVTAKSATAITADELIDGKNYVCDEDAVSEIGWIWTSEIWEDVTLPGNLLRKAKARMQELSKGVTSMELTIVDESDAGADIGDIRARMYVRCISKPHGIDGTYLCLSRTVDYLNPAGNTITIGASGITLSSASAKQDQNISDLSDELVGVTGEIKTINEQKMYRTETYVDGVNIFRDKGQHSILRCRVFSWDKEITELLDASSFVWHRNSGDEAADADWDASHVGMKYITVTTEDVQDNASFYCEITI